MPKNTPKKLGIAMSGSGARSAFYIGFMEVLAEEQIPVYAISAQSGASIVAVAFANNTLEKLKADVLTLNWKKVRTFFSLSKTGLGLCATHKGEAYLRENYTLGKTFDDIPIKLCFPATDLNSGELVQLVYGDLARAIITTCSVPGIFEPVRWGNKLLLDGGILSTIPSASVKDFGAEVVVSVSIRATNHVFPSYQLKLKEKYNNVKQMFNRLSISRVKFSTPAGHKFGSGSLAELEYEKEPTMHRILAKSLDLALKASKGAGIENEKKLCDLLITEGEGNFGDSFSISKSETLYNYGRKVATAHLSKIKELIYA